MAECGTCKAPVLWTGTPAGKRAPIDPEPNREKGNTVLLSTRALPGVVLSIVLSGKALVLARTCGHAPMYTNHWATCPDRREWRERTDAKKEAEGDASDRG